MYETVRDQHYLKHSTRIWTQRSLGNSVSSQAMFLVIKHCGVFFCCFVCLFVCFFPETTGLSFEDNSSVTHQVVYKLEGRVNIARRKKKKESGCFIVQATNKGDRITIIRNIYIQTYYQFIPVIYKELIRVNEICKPMMQEELACSHSRIFHCYWLGIVKIY